MSDTWLTRREAAAHLKISTRQLDRLRLPRSTALGSMSPRYALSVLDSHLAGTLYSPRPNRTATKRAARYGRPPSVPTDVKAEREKYRLRRHR